MHCAGDQPLWLKCHLESLWPLLGKVGVRKVKFEKKVEEKTKNWWCPEAWESLRCLYFFHRHSGVPIATPNTLSSIAAKDTISFYLFQRLYFIEGTIIFAHTNSKSVTAWKLFLLKEKKPRGWKQNLSSWGWLLPLGSGWVTDPGGVQELWRCGTEGSV